MRLLSQESNILEGMRQNQTKVNQEMRRRQPTDRGRRASLVLGASQPSAGTPSTKMLTLAMKHFLLEECLQSE